MFGGIITFGLIISANLESNLFCITSIFVYQIFSSFIYCRYPDVLQDLNSSNSDIKVCSYLIDYIVSRACLMSCNFLKNATILELFILCFCWQFIANKRRSCSQDWIIVFFIISLCTHLIPYCVFYFMLFLIPTRFC